MSRRAGADSATPARNTRARSRSQTPLPGLATKQSHAYGAQGKTNLHTQVRATGDTNFAEDFTAAATTTAGMPAPSPAKRGGLRQRGGHAPPPAPILEEEESDEDDELETAEEPTDPGRVQTAVGRGMGYGGADPAAAHDAGIVQAVPAPSAWRVSFRAFPRWVRLLVLGSADGRRQILAPILLRAFAVLCFGMLVYGWLPLPTWWSSFRFRQFWGVGMVLGIPGYEKPPHEAEELWFRVRHDVMLGDRLPGHNMPDIQWAVNLNILERMKDYETDQQKVQSALGLQGETLDYLKRILPVTIVLQEGEEERLHIPATFWQALSQKIAEGGDEVAPLWDSFISSNKEEVLALSLDAANRIISEATKEKRLVLKEDLVQMLEQQNLDLAERYMQDYRRMWQQNFETVRETAQKTTEEIMERFTTDTMVKKQLEVLAKAVDLQNTYEGLRTYNWFTHGESALIDPHLTSATAEPPSTGRLSRWWGKEGPLSFTQKPPATVLLPWTEVTDCWCAAPANDGSAQISMFLTQELYPDRLVIEHMPAGGTRRIANAPRTIEIWADAGTEAEAKRLGEVIEETIPYRSQKECTKRPSERHICLGKGEYDIHQHNHVQSLPIWTDAKSIGLAVNSFTIRIVNNWGGQRTCLYRLRMIGEQAHEPPYDGFED